MKTTLIILGVLDFAIGLFFGNIGHFYSLLCFPLMAVIRGYIGVHSGHKSIRHSIWITLSGGIFFFIGLIIGSYMLMYRIPMDSTNELITPIALNQAFTLSVVTSFLYFALYMVFGGLSGFLCKEINTMKHMQNKEREV